MDPTSTLNFHRSLVQSVTEAGAILKPFTLCPLVAGVQPRVNHLGTGKV